MLSLNCEIQKFETDFDGRYICLDLLISSVPYRLINIYAHNNEKDRKDFFNNLHKYLVCNRHVIFFLCAGGGGRF